MTPTDAHFRILVEAIRDYAIYFLDPEGRVQSWNEGARRLKGYRAEEIVGHSFARFFRPEDVDAGLPQQALATALLDGRFEDVGWRVRKDGTQFWADAVIVPLRDEHGRHLGFAKTTRDASAAAYQTFVEVANNIVWTTDASGRPNADSPSWRSFTGQNLEQWLGRQGWDPVHPDDLPRLRLDWPKARDEQHGFESEFRLRRHDGAYVWMACRAVPIRYPNGVVREWFGVTTDISARKRAEAELERALSLWETTLQSIGDAVVATDLEGRVTFMNPVAEELTRWSKSEGQSRPLTDIFSIVNEETRKVVANPVAKVLQEGAIVGLANHTVLVRRDGSDVPIDDSAAPIRDRHGTMHGAVLVFRDVSHEKRELARRTYLARAGEALLSAGDYRDALATVANLAVPRLADWCTVDMVEEGDPVPRSLAIAHVDPAKVAFARELGRRYPPRPEATTGSVHVVRTGRSEIYPEIPPELLEQGAVDGEHRRLIQKLQLRSAIVVPLRGRQRILGAITFVYAESGRRYSEEDLVLAEDLARRASMVIERRQMEEERAGLLERERAARQQAELANRAKDEFLAVVSHELRTPLTVILGRSHLLSHANLSPDALKHVQVIERNARTQASLVEDVLDVSRVLSGKLRLEIQATDVPAVVSDALSAARDLAKAKEIEFSAKVEPNLEVRADPIRLQQIVANLANNAVKFTPRGGKVEVEARRAGSDLELQVRDTGEGIERSLLTEIFEPFRQADSSTTRRHGGLGLGLTIVRQLVQAHGGWVRAESPGPGGGSTFVVAIPRVRPPSGSFAPVRAQTPAPARKLEGVRVLVVDDYQDALEVFADLLTEAGAKVEMATSAAEAWAKLPAFHPQVLVTDLGMPDEDGYQFLSRVRGRPNAVEASVPAVAVTAYASAEDRDRVLAAGFQAHVPKPVDGERLVQVVASLAGAAPG